MFRRQFAALVLLFTLLAPYAAFGQQPQGPQQHSRSTLAS